MRGGSQIELRYRLRELMYETKSLGSPNKENRTTSKL